MTSIKLLDCTLREAPFPELDFGAQVIQNVISDFVQAGLDIVECGFLKDIEYKRGTTLFSSVEQIEEYKPADMKGALLVALVDYGRYSLDKLSPWNGKSIDGIRICFKKDERNNVFTYAKQIKELGYKVFIQQVDTLDYTDSETLELIGRVNELKPYAYSIVDTFGAMYEDDVKHLFSLANRNLDPDITLGFHSHNNLDIANSLVQSFVRYGAGQRNVVVDATVCGMGRGAGNANTELVAEFLNRKFDRGYDINTILDAIDLNMPDFLSKASWGYSIPYFITGVHGTHVYNVNYLLERHNISSRDLRNIIGKLDNNKKKIYDYSYLEDQYFDYFNREVEDHQVENDLRKATAGKKVLLIAPGPSTRKRQAEIESFIHENSPIVISVNWRCPFGKMDFEFYSNSRRYRTRMFRDTAAPATAKIITSNIKTEADSGERIVSYPALVERTSRNRNFDTSIILVLHLLLKLEVGEVFLAGVDGFQESGSNYASESFELDYVTANYKHINEDLAGMLAEVKRFFDEKKIGMRFITETHLNIPGICQLNESSGASKLISKT